MALMVAQIKKIKKKIKKKSWMGASQLTRLNYLVAHRATYIGGEQNENKSSFEYSGNSLR